MTQLKLITGDPLRWPEPVKQGDAHSCLYAAQHLLPEVKRWFGKDWREEEKDEVLKQLVNALYETIVWDGFDLCKTLDRSGWDPDSELVEIMESAGHCFYTFRDKFIADWIAEHDVKPKLSVGDKVRLRVGDPGLAYLDHRFKKGDVIDGTITRIDKSTYTVNVPAAGHMTEAMARAAGGTTGYCLRWDYVEASNERCQNENH